MADVDKSGLYEEAATQFVENINNLYRIEQLVSARATHGNAVVEWPQIEGPPKNVLMFWDGINVDQACLDLGSILNILSDSLCPRIRRDENYSELVRLLGKYKKPAKWSLRRKRTDPDSLYDLDALADIATNVAPLRSKLRLLLTGLERVDNGLVRLEGTDPEEIISGIVPFAKPTEDLSEYIKDIKVLIGDSGETPWYQYRRKMVVFNDALKTFGMKEAFLLGEDMLDTFKKRYEDDSHLHLTDLNYLRRLLHTTEDHIEKYKEKTKSLI